MRQSPSSQKLLSNQSSDNLSADQSDSPVKRCRYFEEYSGASTPFDVQVDVDYKEDVFAGAGVNK